MADPVETMPAEDSLESPLEPQSEALETQAYEAPTYQSDDPDLNYEAKLHDIFLNYYNAKTPEAEWTTLVGERHSERYQIQQGDTLWDISKTLFGDGNYWPKVWSLNTSIKNPHLISPNNSIRFLLGDESEPPAFTVTKILQKVVFQVKMLMVRSREAQQLMRRVQMQATAKIQSLKSRHHLKSVVRL